VIASARTATRRLFNNAAQAWNHGFYWHSLAPAPSDRGRAAALDRDRVRLAREARRRSSLERGTGHFANGWVWLARRAAGCRSRRRTTATRSADGDVLPLLTIDLWEHAYYLDHQNERPQVPRAGDRQHLNWDFAAENFARAHGAGRYPAPGLRPRSGRRRAAVITVANAPPHECARIVARTAAGGKNLAASPSQPAGAYYCIRGLGAWAVGGLMTVG
jgi:Fe-Mn family superoxide dismutase